MIKTYVTQKFNYFTALHLRNRNILLDVHGVYFKPIPQKGILGSVGVEI